MTAATATKPTKSTATKPATKSTTTAKIASTATAGPTTTTKKDSAPGMKQPTTTATPATTAKPTPPAKVAEYIATLSADEQRYGRKAWRHGTGQRSTAPSQRGITQEQAKSIRERIAELTR